MSLNVLVVDDSSVMRSIIKKVLSLSGFPLETIYEAPDGKAGLEVMDRNWIDVVLTDVNMPVMNGYEFLSAIKANEELSRIPVIIISTEVRDEKIEEMLRLGASGYITKPFRPEDIRTVFAQTLGVTADGTHAEEPEGSDF